MGDLAPDLVGRDAELAELLPMGDPTGLGRVLVLLGESGAGKTALLDVLAGKAGSAGMRVLPGAAARPERKVPFAGLHHLFHPVLNAAAGLPARHRQALASALGAARAAEPTDRLLVGMATLGLVRRVSVRAPLLVVVDDVQWLDESSLAALAFACRRLNGEAASFVLAGRADVPPDGFGPAVSELYLGPLADQDTHRLLDRQPVPPEGPLRARVIAQAAGNPAALIELSRVAASLPAMEIRRAADPLPLPRRLAGVYERELSALPEPAQSALLLASAAGPADLAAVLERQHIPDVGALSAAEMAGLVRVGVSGIEFVHPLVRSAAYHWSSFQARGAAHRWLADVLADLPDRQAWHLGRATLGPDEDVASLLEDTCDQARRRDGYLAAAIAMERAAALSSGRGHRARRLAAAAWLARHTGDATWAGDLANRAASMAADPVDRARAGIELGWALTWTGHYQAALSVLLPIVSETSPAGTALPWEAVQKATAAAYLSGTGEARRAVAGALKTVERAAPPQTAPGEPSGARYARAVRLWAAAAGDPHGFHPPARELRQLAELPLGVHSLATAGAAAWLLDEPDLATRLLRCALAELHAPGADGNSIVVLVALIWTCADAGRWDEALAACAELSSLPASGHQPFPRVLADLAAATVRTWRGDLASARKHLAAALATMDPDGSRAAGAWGRRAAGLISLAEDSHIAAYLELRRLFADDGEPFHYHVSYLGLADLAEAGARSGQAAEARDWVDRAVRRLPEAPGPRITQLIARARGLLAGPREAGRRFAAALEDPAGEQWPFERAQLRLDYGGWLRRNRRISESKKVLTEALDTFTRLAAAPWTERAAQELRAAGIRPATPPTSAASLTPQEHQVVYLASQGLTNRQIAGMLHLSPRTVGAHLHRSFPKLGVTRRQQIRDIPAPGHDPRASGGHLPALPADLTCGSSTA